MITIGKEFKNVFLNQLLTKLKTVASALTIASTSLKRGAKADATVKAEGTRGSFIHKEN